MTNDEFTTLCEQVLVPRIANFLHSQFADVQETLDIITRQLARMEDRLEDITPINLDDQ